MSLSPIKETVDTGVAVFSKILELFTGGFSLSITGFTSGVTLPKGSLLKVDEEARTATPVKTAVVGATGDATTLYLETGHHFEVGDYIAYGATGAPIESIEDGTGDYDGLDKVSVGTAEGDLSASSKDDVVWNSATGGATGVNVAPNALSRYAVTIEDGAVVTAVRRGTAYKKRIQDHVSKLTDTLPATIQLSESY
jgi:hypothetical protein